MPCQNEVLYSASEYVLSVYLQCRF